MKTTTIRAGNTEGQYWSDLWSFRELFYFLAWRDVTVRYKQAIFGVAWAFVRPILTVAIFTFVFQVLGRFPSDGSPYPLMVFAGLLPWQLFASSLAESSNSLVTNAHLVSKVYFPRLLVPLSSISVAVVDFLLASTILVILMIVFGVTPTWRVLTLPFFLALAVFSAASISVWLSALNVKFRDVRILVPFIVQFGLYLSPVGFPVEMVPEKWLFWYSLNPMVSVIQGFRWALLANDAYQIFWPGLALGMLVASTLLFFGIRYFRKTEKTLPDVI